MAIQTTGTLSVRLDPEILQALTDYANGHRGVTKTKIIERLISYFVKRSPEQQQLIIAGEVRDYLEVVGKALQSISWGDHAYRRGFLPWAIETYGSLDSIAGPPERTTTDVDIPPDLVGILSLRRVAWFKLAAAWMDLSAALRAEALAALRVSRDIYPSGWADYYGAAIDGLRIAIAYYQLFNKSLEDSGYNSNPATLFNQACAWSLMAQYMAERSSDAGALRNLAATGDGTTTQATPSDPSNDKRSDLRDTPDRSAALDRAMRCLRRVDVGYDGDAAGLPMSDTLWMFDEAERDSDLSALRLDREVEFGAWLNERKSRTSILDSFARLRERLPEHVQSALRSIDE